MSGILRDSILEIREEDMKAQKDVRPLY